MLPFDERFLSSREAVPFRQKTKQIKRNRTAATKFKLVLFPVSLRHQQKKKKAKRETLSNKNYSRSISRLFPPQSHLVGGMNRDRWLPEASNLPAVDCSADTAQKTLVVATRPTTNEHAG